MNQRLKMLLTLPAIVAAMASMAPSAAGAPDRRQAQRPNTASKKIRILEKQTRALAKRLAALEAKQVPPPPPPPVIPTALPPSGPAGGSLRGAFPNPSIAPAAVGSTEIADGSVGSADIADGAVGAAELAPASVGPAALHVFSVTGPILATDSATAHTLNLIFVRESSPVTVAGGQTKAIDVGCSPGERLISGGFEWSNPNDFEFVIYSGPVLAEEGRLVWEVVGSIPGGRQTSQLTAFSRCL